MTASAAQRDWDPDQFQSVYGKYTSETISPMRNEAKRIFKTWTSREFWEPRFPGAVAIPMPIQRSYSRVKRHESVLDKMKNKSLTPSRDDLRSLHDFLGFRLILYVASHIPKVDEAIRSSGDFVLHPDITPKWYYPDSLLERLDMSAESFKGNSRKNSGYASIHYILRPSRLDTDAWFELQIRTMLFDAWGEIEHKMIYKPQASPEFNTHRHLQIMADQLMALEEHFDVVYERMTYLQNTTRPKSDDLLTDTTLPFVCMAWEVPLTQTEISRLCTILHDAGIANVKDLEERVPTETLQRLKAFMNNKGRPLTAFHVISVASRLKANSSAKDAVRVLNEQLEFVSVTERMRNDAK